MVEWRGADVIVGNVKPAEELYYDRCSIQCFLRYGSSLYYVTEHFHHLSVSVVVELTLSAFGLARSKAWIKDSIRSIVLPGNVSSLAGVWISLHTSTHACIRTCILGRGCFLSSSLCFHSCFSLFETEPPRRELCFEIFFSFRMSSLSLYELLPLRPKLTPLSSSPVLFPSLILLSFWAHLFEKNLLHHSLIIFFFSLRCLSVLFLSFCVFFTPDASSASLPF